VTTSTKIIPIIAASVSSTSAAFPLFLEETSASGKVRGQV
jgi:hypothetical protein